MKIGTCQAEPGALTRGRLQVAVDPETGPVFTPVAIARGREGDRTMFLSAGVHGDEINGIEILHRFIQNLDVTALRGTLIFLPLVNVAGFKARQRSVPYDEKDLNRCFPGDPEGTISDQIAYTIFEEVVSRCDFGVDVHDSGEESVLLPHPRAHIRDASGGYDRKRMQEIAVFGTDIIMLTRGMDGVMTIEAGRRLNVSAFTVEIGGGMVLWEGFIRRALAGLRNLLIHREMLKGKRVLPQHQFILPGEDDIARRASIEGILHLKTRLGKAVNVGETLAEIHNPITLEREVIQAGQCGVVHALNIHAKVDAGEDVVGILEFTSCPERGRKPTAMNVETLSNKAAEGIELRPSELFEEALTLQISD